MVKLGEACSNLGQISRPTFEKLRTLSKLAKSIVATFPSGNLCHTRPEPLSRHTVGARWGAVAKAGLREVHKGASTLQGSF